MVENQCSQAGVLFMVGTKAINRKRLETRLLQLSMLQVKVHASWRQVIIMISKSGLHKEHQIKQG